MRPAAVLYLAVAVRLFALDPQKAITQFGHNAWTQQDGLPWTDVRAMAQTPDGYLWLGTTGGLIRFDGIRFTEWQPDKGEPLPRSVVLTLLSGRDGSLWIGTHSGWISRMRNNRLENYSARQGASAGSIRAIVEDPAGGFWIATEDGMCHFRDGRWQRVEASGLPSTFLTSLLRDPKGDLWTGTLRGLWMLPAGGQTFQRKGAGSGEISGLSMAADGSVWAAELQDGVEAFGLKSMRHLDGETPRASAILHDRQDNLWIGTEATGLYFSPAGSGKLEHFTRADGLPNNSIRSLLEDREGNVWVGTMNGLLRFRDTKFTAFSTREGLASDAAMTLASAPDGSIWVGTMGGLDRIRNGEVRHYGERDGLPSATVLSSDVDRQGTLWVGTQRGVARLSGERFERVPIPSQDGLNSVWAMTRDLRGALWLGDQGGGVYRWEDGRLTDFSEAMVFRGKRPRSAHTDREGRVWLGLLPDGIAVFDKGQWRAYSERDGLAPGVVRTIYEDARGRIWAGGEGGVSLFCNGRFTSFNSANGLPADYVSAMTEDESGKLWIATTAGIVAVDPAEFDKAAAEPSYQMHCRLYTSADGIRGAPRQLAHCGAARGRDNRLWFLSSEGVLAIDPNYLPENPLPPPVHVEGILADGHKLTPSAGLRLPALTKDLRIDYTALSLVAPKRVRFRYRLEGFNRKWVEAGTRREAFYTNLPPGDYRFRVVASNNDGVWNEAGAMWSFGIEPAFYQAAWFRGISVVLAAILLWFAYLLRLRQLRDRFSARLEERVAERTRIAQDLHDTLLQGVVAVSLQLEVMDKQLGPEPVPARRTLDKALGSVREVIEEGRRAVLNLRSSMLTRYDLAQSLSRAGEELANEESQIRVVVQGRPRGLDPLVEEEIYRIGREALANAVRHARAGTVEARLFYGRNFLALVVRDDGCGIAPEIMESGRPGHFGLQGMRERAERINARLVVRSRPGTGTEVELRCPGRAAFREQVRKRREADRGGSERAALDSDSVRG